MNPICPSTGSKGAASPLVKPPPAEEPVVKFNPDTHRNPTLNLFARPPFQLFQQLEYHGDYHEAVGALSSAGWGKETPTTKDVPALKVINQKSLLEATYPPQKWIVPSILPTGLAILAGKPKSGKSILALNLSLAVANGHKALDSDSFKVEPGSVLYCALEDSYRRLQDRTLNMISHMNLAPSEDLEFTTDMLRLPQGIQQIDKWLQNTENPRFVVIDIFARVKESSSGKGTLYDTEYSSLGPLQRFAQDTDIGLLLVHHTRKAQAVDEFDTVSGSTAITGAADTSMLLTGSEESNSSILHIKGRDLEERELSLSLNPEALVWAYTGPVISRQPAPRQAQIIDLLNSVGEALTIKAIREGLGLQANTVNQLLHWMKEKGIVETPQRGLYQLSADYRGHKRHKKELDPNQDKDLNFLCHKNEGHKKEEKSDEKVDSYALTDGGRKNIKALKPSASEENSQDKSKLMPLMPEGQKKGPNAPVPFI